MSNIPLVQGVAVEGQHQTSSYQNHPSNAENSSGNFYAQVPADQGIRQEPVKQFQDVGWAIAFILHLIVMGFMIVVGLSNHGDNNANDANYALSRGAIILTVSTTGLAAVGFSSLALSLMMKYTETLVQVALVFSVICSLVVGVLGFLQGNLLMGILGLISFAIGLWYAKIVWPRIPFAAANLNTALTAVRQNLGLVGVAFGMTVLAFVWTIFWFLGVGNAMGDENEDGESQSNLIVVFLLFLSYYWVHQVLQNTMHVTTAGVIGTWWFVPDEASSWWSSAISGSFFRAITYSFGSIAFGSFLVALVRALRALERYSRDNDELNFLSCILQCILSCLESILEELNQWAYVYVGLYGFSYLDASRNVMQLFKAKGWTVVIADDLCDNVLFMISLAIGLSSGLVGLVVGSIDSGMFDGLGFENAAGPAFVIGLLTGFLFATVLMSVVGSGVNTVIVCYAEDPAAFQLHHPQLSTNMRSAWAQAWPGVVM